MSKWYEKARRRLEERNMLIKDLADLLGITPGAVGHYLAGRRVPKMETLVSIANALDLSVSELIENDMDVARNPLEIKCLETFRLIPEHYKGAALAMLCGLAASAALDA